PSSSTLRHPSEVGSCISITQASNCTGLQKPVTTSSLEQCQCARIRTWASCRGSQVRYRYTTLMYMMAAQIYMIHKNSKICMHGCTRNDVNMHKISIINNLDSDF